MPSFRRPRSYQVINNLESQRRQYGLVERARQLGWDDVQLVDDDLGRSGGGTVRPGFEKLLAAICEGRVGAVVSLEASRLARNGRDWHTLLEFCGLVGTLIVDEEAIYDPRSPNDRLLLGMKGTMSEMELSVFRQRSIEAMRQKARRGELHLTVAVGYVKTDDNRIEKDPDRRVQDGILLVFQQIRRTSFDPPGPAVVQARKCPRPDNRAGSRQTPDRVEGASLPYATSCADEPGVRWLLCLRPARNARDDRGWPEADHARQPPTRLEGMGGFDPRSP